MSSGVCYSCGEEFVELGSHWSRGKCQYADLTDTPLDIVTGLLMGDGTLGRDSKNSRVVIHSIIKEYLKYLSSQFGLLGNPVRFHQSAEESFDSSSGFRNRTGVDNYSDVYEFSTMRHPQLNCYENWYSSGEKVWPNDIELSPTVLKHWYCGDGSFDGSSISIAISNERGNEEKVNEYFGNAGLPEPNNYTEWERGDGSLKFDLHFTVKQSKRLFEYMGDPPPGFEYKWPEP